MIKPSPSAVVTTTKRRFLLVKALLGGGFCVAMMASMSGDQSFRQVQSTFVSNIRWSGDTSRELKAVGDSQCISLMSKNESSPSDFQQMLRDNDQVYLVNPCKAGGTSVKAFANQCMGRPEEYEQENFMFGAERLRHTLTSQVQTAPLLASHVTKEEHMVDLIHHSARKTLIVYLYREETDRLASAISYIVRERLCHESTWNNVGARNRLGLRLTENSCGVNEEALLTWGVAQRMHEVGSSVYQTITCNVWDEVDDTAPNLLFVHYKQLDTLQKELSDHFCPSHEPKDENADPHGGKMTYSIYTERDGEVPLDDWVKGKRNTIEYMMKISKGSCKRRIRAMEDTLFSCPEEAVRVFPAD